MNMKDNSSETPFVANFIHFSIVLKTDSNIVFKNQELECNRFRPEGYIVLRRFNSVPIMVPWAIGLTSWGIKIYYGLM
jgi:hypothetical protein